MTLIFHEAFSNFNLQRNVIFKQISISLINPFYEGVKVPQKSSALTIFNLSTISPWLKSWWLTKIAITSHSEIAV